MLVLSGPGGVGKSTIAAYIRKNQTFWVSVSSTTRKPRPNEKDGVDYYLLSDKEFDGEIAKNHFLEWAHFAGARYGTPREAVEKVLSTGTNVLLEIEIEGAKQVVDDVKKMYPKDSKIVFLGEGGDENNKYVKGSEQEYIHNELKKHYPNFTNDSWDGKELDVHNDQSMLYNYQKKKTGLPHDIVMAGNWANMVGQNEVLKAEDYLSDDGKNFLQQSAKEAGFPPISNFDKPNKKDKKIISIFPYCTR